MSERVKKRNGQLKCLSSQVEVLQSNMHQLVQVLKESIATKENDANLLKTENTFLKPMEILRPD